MPRLVFFADKRQGLGLGVGLGPGGQMPRQEGQQHIITNTRETKMDESVDVDGVG